jgi:ubiquinone/menaquinone biosynthesis C-methylase UbiE
MDSLIDYYNRRSDEYERIYHRDDPVRRAELEEITRRMQQVLRGHRVLEVACGTGFWTYRVSSVVEHITALDAASEMLAIAHSKPEKQDRITWIQGDAFRLHEIEGRFTGGLSNFWFSHIPRTRIQDFLTAFHSRLEPGATVFMADNVYIPGLGGTLVQDDTSEDTFKQRTLSDGSTHRILKNYFSEFELRRLLASHTQSLNISFGTCFWWMTYFYEV